MNINRDLKHLSRSRRYEDIEIRPNKERWALFGCVVLTVIGTLSFLVILADSI